MELEEQVNKDNLKHLLFLLWCYYGVLSLSLALSAKNEFNRLIKGQEMFATLNPYNGHCGKNF